jgi:hypothetical protein
MFGNRLGWGISVLLAALMLFVVFELGKISQIQKPSHGVVMRTGNVTLELESRPQLLDPIQLPFHPQALMPERVDPADASPLYQQAIAEYHKDPERYNDVLDKQGKLKTTSLADLPAFELLIKAKNSRNPSVFGGRIDDLIEVRHSPNPAPLAALGVVGMSASKMAQVLLKDGRQGDDAKNLAQAVFSLGVKLCEERLRWREFDVGQQMARDGLYLIKKADPSKAPAADAAEQGLRALLKDRLIPLSNVLTSADQFVIGRTGGDIFYIARNAKERMWRIEATLKLGWYRFNQGEEGHGPNGRWAMIVLKRMAADDSLEPAIRAAAVASRDWTFDDYQNMTASRF